MAHCREFLHRFMRAYDEAAMNAESFNPGRFEIEMVQMLHRERMLATTSLRNKVAGRSTPDLGWVAADMTGMRFKLKLDNDGGSEDLVIGPDPNCQDFWIVRGWADGQVRYISGGVLYGLLNYEMTELPESMRGSAFEG